MKNEKHGSSSEGSVGGAAERWQKEAVARLEGSGESPLKKEKDVAGFDLEREIADILPKATRIKVIPLEKRKGENGEGEVLLAMVRHPAVPRKEVLQQRAAVVRHFALRGQTMLVAFYTDRQWAELDRQCSEGEWGGCFDMRHGGVALARLYKEKKAFPVKWRKLLLTKIDYCSSMIDVMMGSSGFPTSVSLDCLATAIEEVFRMLLASKGAAFTPGAALIRDFESHFATDPNLRPDDPLLYFDLLALSRKTGHLFALTGDQPDEPQREELFSDLQDFLKRARRYVRAEFTSEKEKRGRRIALFCAGAAAAAIVLIVVAWHLTALIPMSPMKDVSAIKKPGGITGVYYSGTSFNKKIMERTDNHVFFRSSASVAPGVPADRFSVRWSGYVKVPETGARWFCTHSDDGVRLFIGDKLIIDDWREKPMNEVCKKVRLRKGWHKLKVEYFEAGGDSIVNLLWGSSPKSLVSIPSANLCCKK